LETAGTHVPVLAACVARTQGPVLELGAGDYSTPLLHLLCKGRFLVTVESNPDWLGRYKDTENPLHRLLLVKSYDEAKIIDEIKWDVALVDHAPGERRVTEIKRLKDRTMFIVVHDTDDPGYHYEPVLAGFKYRYDYKRWRRWVAVVSMFEPFEP